MAAERSAFGYTFKIIEPHELDPRCEFYSPAEYVEHEPPFEIWCRGIKKGDVVVDAGACFGAYAFPALCAGAKVVVYEPWSEGRRVLDLNARLNRFSGLTVRPFAIWDKTPLSKELYDRVWGYHYPHAGEIVTVNLDDDLASIGVTRVDWMKFDIEGAELPALLGARKMLKRDLPSLVIEDHDDINPDPACVVSRYAASIDSSRRIHKMLADLGYVVEVLPWNCGRRYIVARHPNRPSKPSSDAVPRNARDSIEGPIGPFYVPKEPAETRRICVGLSRGVWGSSGAYDRPEARIPEYEHEALSIEGVRRVVDIGAGWGAFAVWALSRWGNGGASAKDIELECYEPNPLAIEYLAANTRGYNVRIHQLAVSSEPSVVLSRSLDWGALQTHSHGDGDAVSTVHPRDLPPCDVLKCDAEGIEPEVFRNYRHFKTVKAIIYEWHGGEHRRILQEIFRPTGMRCVRDDDGPWGGGNGSAVWIQP